MAALLFSVSLLGLLQYHQVLLETFAVTGRLDAEPPLDGWRREAALDDAESDCRRLTVRVQTPQRQWATLSRWYCTRF